MIIGKSKGLSSVLTLERIMGLYFDKGMSFLEIGRMYGCKSSNIAYYFRKYGLKGRDEGGSFKGKSPWNKGKRIADGTITNRLYLEDYKQRSWLKGQDHPNYKGGWVQDGYRYISVDGRQVAEHHWFIEQQIGRKLRSDEVVHHKNGDRLDNRLENLELMTRAQHINHHRRELTEARFGSN